MQFRKAARLRAVVLSLLSFLALGAGTASAQVVISQAYGGGGNSGATYTNDFIEIFNRGSTPADLTGWSVQYASAAGAAWQVTNLSGTLQPGQYYLIQEAVGAGGTVPLPTPNATGTIAMSGTAFKVALVNVTTALSVACPASTLVEDLVGAASTANCSETSPAPAPSNTTAVMRANGGCTDTGNNSTDFSALAPTPRNTGAPFNLCGGGPGPTGPVVSFPSSTVSVMEGDATPGTLAFEANFTTIAAGNTVSFNIAVSGTAGRYSYTGPASVTLDESSTSPYLIQVATVPNTITDGNATVTVTLSGFAGTDASQVSPLVKEGTIIDDDINLRRINEIQGAGQASSFDGQIVTTRGIVTGTTSAGRFYIQSLPADVDADENTSEALYVYGVPSPTVSLVVGDVVQVTGVISEYTPGAQLPITELVSPVTAIKLSSGHSLPAPIVLTAAEVGPGSFVGALEKYEFMRVTVPSFVAVAPTGPGTNDEFFGVIEGIDRPFREAGVELYKCGVNPAIPGSLPLPDTDPANNNIPCWDQNPELLRVKTNLLTGGAVVPIRTGTKITNLTGILDYAFKRYTIDTSGALDIDASHAESGTPVSDPLPTDITISGYNVENMACTLVSGSCSSSPSATYNRKATKIARTIVEYLKTPDVVGLIEVGNLQTLQDVATRVSAMAANDPQYQAVLLSNSGTQRLGFLLKKSLVGGTPRVTLVEAYEPTGAADMRVLCPDGVSLTTGLLNDRAPLVVSLTIRGPNGVDLPLTVINNHLKSLIDVDSMADASASYACFNYPTPPYTTLVPGGEGRRNRAKRQQNAEYAAMLVATLQDANSNQPIVLVGDFNAFQFNDGYADLSNTVAGTPPANDETVVPGDGVDLVDPDLVILANISSGAVYSYTYEGNAQALDQILANEAMLLENIGLPRLEYARVNADFHQNDATNDNNAFGNSDHDPSLAFFNIARFQTVLPPLIFSNSFED